jgi:hypothetical protein
VAVAAPVADFDARGWYENALRQQGLAGGGSEHAESTPEEQQQVLSLRQAIAGGRQPRTS